MKRWMPWLCAGLTPMLPAQETTPAQGDAVVAARIRSLETGWEGDHLTGNWGGFRDRLVDRGIHFSAGYAAEVFGNVSGGMERDAVVDGLLEMGLDVDPSRFSGWSGALFHVSMLFPHGASLTDKVGDLSTISNIDAEDGWKLFEWWLDQRLFRERVSIRLGQLAADEEFSISEHSSLLINSTFGWPSFDGVNAPAPAFPLASLGARIQVQAADALLFRAGIYDGDPDPGDSQGHPTNPHGTRPRISSEEGAFMMGEADYTPWWATDSAWPGTLKVGGWYHTGDFPNLAHASASQPGQGEDNWGLYLVVDQRVWPEPGPEDTGPDPDQGLSVWLRAAGHPEERSLIERYIDGGLHYRGLLPGRDHDEAGLGVAWLDMSDAAGEEAVANGEPRLDYEIAIEATYLFILNSWWSLQPDLQYIIHPGGSDAVENALVLGLRTSLVF